jgi:hypothetical protein
MPNSCKEKSDPSRIGVGDGLHYECIIKYHYYDLLLFIIIIIFTQTFELT